MRRKLLSIPRFVHLRAMKRFLAIAILVTGSGFAAPVTLRVAAPAEVRCSFQRLDAPVLPLERTLPPGESLIELPAGTWQLDASAPGQWHERQLFTVPAP